MLRCATGWVLLSLFACGGSSLGPELADPTLDGVAYTLRLDDTLGVARVEACFEGPPPPRLLAPDPASELIARATTSSGVPLSVGRVIELDRLAPGECARWEVDLRASSSRDVMQRDGELLVVPGLLFWRPQRDVRARVRLELPPGVHVSAPWTPHAETTTDAFRTPGNLAFTRTPTIRFREGETTVELARFSGALPVDDAGLERWIRAALRAVDTFGDGFPVPHLHVVVLPAGPGWRPVAFGLVRRGGGPSVMLLVHSDTSEEALTRDWTAVHELSHLAMPRMYEEDRWISEGLATYFQEVLRARGGLVSDDDAWAAIAGGFERGRAVGTGRTLWREARDMMHTGAFRRVYWAGTAWALEADVLLRERGRTLDGLLAATRARWSTRDAWHGRELLAACDRELGEPLLVPLAERYGDASEFPDTDTLLASLGVRFGARDLELDDAAPRAALRRAITAVAE